MQVRIDIPPERIAALMTTVIESGDPVTDARKGGWCAGINWKKRSTQPDSWYSKPETWAGEFLIEVKEYDEDTGTTTAHVINKAGMAYGLNIMALKFSHHFAQILADEIDAPCADIFLQCVVFGEEKYA